jgi:hypothetical protein
MGAPNVRVGDRQEVATDKKYGVSSVRKLLFTPFCPVLTDLHEVFLGTKLVL